MTPGRIHHLDGLRAGLMLLGVPFHAALAFSGGGWLVSSPVDAPALAAMADFLHAWRMPAFFLVAGFFAGLVIRRRGAGPWFRGRLARLGVPLIAGVILTVPLQWILVGLFRYGTWSQAWWFVGRLASAPSDWWVLHLWFLLDLLLYCAVLAMAVASPLRPVLGRCGDFIVDAVHRRPALTTAVVLLGAAACVLFGRLVWRVLQLEEVLNGLVSRDLVSFAPAFAVGVLLGCRRALLALITARVATVAFALVAITASLLVGSAPDSAIGAVVRSVASTTVGLTAAVVAVGIASRLLDRPRRVIRWLVDASLVVYIVHQPIVLALAVGLFSFGVFGLAGWAVTVVAAFALSALAYELVNLTPGLRFLLTGRRARQASLLTMRERARTTC